jgi:hypothetical protein
MMTAMQAPPLIYPPSFAATAALSLRDCTRLEQLTPEQRAELESGIAYLRAINHPHAPRRRNVQDLPGDFRAKVASYGQALIDQKMGLRA